MRRNVVDLAVGVVWRGIPGKIVSSLVYADIIMPPLGLLIGGIDFKQFAFAFARSWGIFRRSSYVRRVCIRRTC